ncbi:MAG: HEAT repeat domain-containing protein [Chlorobi bacterium]|nr:HEAT repeat domain-containing protein [Chlorobiota bacterium]
MKRNKITYHDVDFDIFPDEYKEILEGLSSKERSVRVNARNKIEDIGMPITEHLKEILYFKDHHLRWEAAKTFSQMALPETITIQIQTLEDDESDIRWIAAEGLSKMGSKVIKPILDYLLEHGTESVHLIKGVYHVLNKIDTDKELKEKLAPLVKSLKKRRSLHEQVPLLAKQIMLEI